MWPKSKGNKLLSFFSLFTSFGTLICCAIPAALVLLGFGATLANFLGEFPQFIWFSEHKAWVFSLSLGMLVIAFFSQRYAETRLCPVDRKDDCQNTKSWSKKVFYLSFIINLGGVFFTFVLPRFL